MLRLARGELTGEGFLDMTRNLGQRRFLDALEVHNPAIICELRDGVFPFFEENAHAIDMATAVLTAENYRRLRWDSFEQTMNGRLFFGGAGGLLTLAPVEPTLKEYLRMAFAGDPHAQEWCATYCNSQSSLPPGSDFCGDDVIFDSKHDYPHAYGVLHLLASEAATLRPRYPQLHRLFAPVWKRLKQWSVENNLDCYWVREAALHTLGYWHWTFVPEPPFFFYYFFNSWTPSPDRQRFTFTFSGWRKPIVHSGWNPFTSAWPPVERALWQIFEAHREDARSRGEKCRGARTAFRRFLSDYRKRMLSLGLERGLKPATVKYAADLEEDSAGRHFRWLALSVGREPWSPQRIAEADGIGGWKERKDHTGRIQRQHTGRLIVREAITRLAKPIELPLPQRRSGRPKKQ
jgi:hypothetical protein